MKLYLTRHGETDWNVQNRVLGRTDIPLNETGLAQARKLAGLMEGTSIDAIYTSPLFRAVVTGEEIAARQLHSCPCMASDCLIEQDFGVYEGLDRGNPSFQRAKREYFKRYEGGESYFDVSARVYPFLREIAREYDSGQAVLIVTHNGICRVISNYFEDMENEAFASFTMGNCEVRKYALSPEPA